MSGKTTIEWTDATWNPIRGCSRVSEGCRNCYAERIAARFSGPGQPYEGLAKLVTVTKGELRGNSPIAPVGTESRWTGEVRFIPELLDQPLRWKRPRKIFVNSMSDLFHEKLKDGWIDQIFAVMALRKHHTFQILTKRPQQMLDYMKIALICGVPIPGDSDTQIERISSRRTGDSIWLVGKHLHLRFRNSWPLPNVWLGVSVEDQKTADERIPLLLQTPAAVRWVSYEPALGPVHFANWLESSPRLDWIVAGGESGPGARPAHPDWFRAARDQCQSAGVPFFFKQWGEWLPVSHTPAVFTEHENECKTFRGVNVAGVRMLRVGKKRAGHLLDGDAWQEFPK